MFKKDILVYIESKQYKHAEYLDQVLFNYISGTAELEKDKPRLANAKAAGYEEKMEYKHRIKMHIQIEVELKSTLRSAFNLIWGQLTPGLQEMIAAHDEYKKNSVSCNLVWLLKQLKIESS